MKLQDVNSFYVFRKISQQFSQFMKLSVRLKHKLLELIV